MSCGVYTNEEPVLDDACKEVGRVVFAGVIACTLAAGSGWAAPDTSPTPLEARPPYVAAPFPDVPPTHWAYEAVEKLRQAGIMIGYPGGTFGARTARSPAETVPFDHWAYDAFRKPVDETIHIRFPRLELGPRTSETNAHRLRMAIGRPLEAADGLPAADSDPGADGRP
jgi:hypothetical protein